MYAGMFIFREWINDTLNKQYSLPLQFTRHVVSVLDFYMWLVEVELVYLRSIWQGYGYGTVSYGYQSVRIMKKTGGILKYGISLEETSSPPALQLKSPDNSSSSPFQTKELKNQNDNARKPQNPDYYGTARELEHFTTSLASFLKIGFSR